MQTVNDLINLKPGDNLRVIGNKLHYKNGVDVGSHQQEMGTIVRFRSFTQSQGELRVVCSVPEDHWYFFPEDSELADSPPLITFKLYPKIT